MARNCLVRGCLRTSLIQMREKQSEHCGALSVLSFIMKFLLAAGLFRTLQSLISSFISYLRWPDSTVFNYTADVERRTGMFSQPISWESGADFERTFFLDLSLFRIFLFECVCFCRSCKKCAGESRCSWLLLRKTQRQIKASNLGIKRGSSKL